MLGASIYVSLELFGVSLTLLNVFIEFLTPGLELIGFVGIGRRHEYLISVFEFLGISDLSQVAPERQTQKHPHEESVNHNSLDYNFNHKYIIIINNNVKIINGFFVESFPLPKCSPSSVVTFPK